MRSLPRSDRPPARVRRALASLRQRFLHRLTADEEATTFLAEQELGPLLRHVGVRERIKRQISEEYDRVSAERRASNDEG